MILLLLLLEMCGMATPAKASSVCEPLRANGLSVQAKNCEKIVKSGSVPNTDALAYSIKYLTQNLGTLKDPSCAIDGVRQHAMPRGYCDDCRNEDRIRNGIKNDCTFVINDLEHKWHGEAHRSPGYFIDLCAESKSNLVTSFYINTGRGSGHQNVADNDDSLAGAFLLEDQVETNFVAMSNTKYKGVRSRLGGASPVIRLVGLQSSNAGGSYDKPFHVAPPEFHSSLGCMGVSEDLYKNGVMQKMVSRGPSLLVSYAGKSFEDHGSCHNVQSERSSGDSLESLPSHPHSSGSVN